ncbi:prostaglandin E2 receptor EP4 subtype-like [Melanaphis sacchari]|uniref:prostaglandin E2 receptor EP4 subtype-like n=1 Tax=Melanaphis sacchari TaxID=742174 RepID=UPI000DC1514D|nr:prostaglandin E2 receptor EP4 subtype-like [Melanaphis sacchari]XP_025199545.1 prostaglandin E2 receptor EP4 subtype-like [Melanaphis sacchari]
MELVVANATASSPLATPVLPVPSAVRSTSVGVQIAFTGLSAFGIFGNLLALFILHRIRSTSNKKHVFMLRCLVTNDLVLLVGRVVHMFVNVSLPYTKKNVWSCRFSVLWRFFGLNSGCVALMMAVERWLALTKPFFYKKYISLHLIKGMMAILCFEILCLMCAPYFGFGYGRYWDEKSSTCVGYRNAKKTLDVLHVYVYLGHGVFLCFAIVYTNLAVMKALCMKNSPHNQHIVTIRRTNQESSLPCNIATKEERSFGWLMFLLCVTFIICWVPQMISIPLSRFVEDESEIRPFIITTEMLLVIHLALNPYLYVLQHWTLVKTIFLSSKINNNVNSSSTSGTLEVYENSEKVLSEQPL